LLEIVIKPGLVLLQISINLITKYERSEKVK
jgi:hypothetical protein